MAFLKTLPPPELIVSVSVNHLSAPRAACGIQKEETLPAVSLKIYLILAHNINRLYNSFSKK